MVKMTLNAKEKIKLTDEEKKMLDKLSKMKDEDIIYDEDSPKLTPEQLSQFRRVSEINQKNRRKQNLTLRVSPMSLEMAKSLGKGYTSILSRVVEYALNNKEFLKKFL